jgi:hypothetical protein
VSVDLPAGVAALEKSLSGGARGVTAR